MPLQLPLLAPGFQSSGFDIRDFARGQQRRPSDYGIPVQFNQLKSLIAWQIISPADRAQRDMFSSEPGVQGGAFDS
jgi:hypothetical protein